MTIILIYIFRIFHQFPKIHIAQVSNYHCNQIKNAQNVMDVIFHITAKVYTLKHTQVIFFSSLVGLYLVYPTY